MNSCAHGLKVQLQQSKPSLKPYNVPDTILTFTFISLFESSQQFCDLDYLPDFTDEKTEA